MSLTFDQTSKSFQDYLGQRAANYDDYSSADLYADIPSELYGNEPAMMSYLRGNETLGVEPREVMHLQSEANGGADVPDNLMLGPRDVNRSIGADDMQADDIDYVSELNEQDVEVLLEADPTVLSEAMPWLPEATTSTTTFASMGAQSDTVPDPWDTVEPEPEIGYQWVERGRGAHLEEVVLDSNDTVIEAADITSTAADAAESGLGEIVGEALAEGLIPAIFAGKAAMAVADQMESTEDKLGYGSLAAGGTVLLYANPVTGPFAWGATAIYSGFKLVQLGCKVVDHCSKQSQNA